MNKLHLIYGNDFQYLFEQSIKQIDVFLKDKTKENIIIVPDRLSLITEQKIFELLKVNTYFNLSVMGISKFLNKIIYENGLNILECSSLQAKLLTLKAIQNTKNQFKCFSKNYTLGLVDEIFAKIEQIKSSNAKIEDLIDEKASVGTRLKFEDLSLIYTEYEKLRSNKLDSGALISLFNNICSDSDFLKKCNVFFVGFDSMTKQGIEVVKNVTKTAQYCSVSILKANDTQKNSRIYDESFYQQINNMITSENFSVTETKLINQIYDDKKIIQENIFCRKKTFDKTNYIKVYKSSNLTDELEFLIKDINYKLKTDNLNFCDISICTSDDFIPIIKSKLNNIGVDCFSDTKISLINLEPIKYLISIMKYLIGNQKEELIKIINNDFCNLEIDDKHTLLNLLDKYTSIYSIQKYQTVNENINNYINSLTALNISKINTVNYFIEFIKNLIKNENLIDKINNYCLIFKNKKEIELEKIYLQVENKLQNVLSQIDEILNQDSITLEEFSNLLETAFKNCEISSIPCTTNQIFIGNYKSFYNNAKHLYIVGANDGLFPDILTDGGLISDKEILSPTIKATLEPTTKVINKRNKFKCVTITLSALKNCHILYHQTDNNGKFTPPAEIVDELKFLFSIEEVITTNILRPTTTSCENLCFNIVNNYNANLNLYTFKDNIYSETINRALNKSNSLFTLIKPNTNLKVNFDELFFSKKKTSISIIEKYNKCPKSCFLEKGIKLQPKEKEKIQANTIGSFIHEIAELFVRKYKNKLGTIPLETIQEFVNITAKEIVTKEYYYSINLDENVFIFNLLISECIRFCHFLNYEQTISEFKPVYTEKSFGINDEFKPLEIMVANKKYYICGIVDKVDVYENYFRIIDYKSGSSNFKNLAEGLFYGTKLQLFVYAQAIKNNIGKKLFGAFYLPIQNKFVKQNQANYSYSGFFLDIPELAQKCDSNLNLETLESKLLGCKFKSPGKNKKMAFWKNKNIISEDDLCNFEKYTTKILSTTIKNMKDGYIECSPMKISSDNSCKHCEYYQICNNKENLNLTRDKLYDTENKNFSEINYD